MKIQSFPPIVDDKAHLLILGSMPGKASLAAGEYYAFGRNAFWDIVERHLAIPRSATYADRRHALLAHGIAVWDVLKACIRESSLDSAIETDSIVTNDFQSFFQQQPNIRHVLFNGSCAEKLFAQHVKPSLQLQGNTLKFTRLPSTSPANARFSFEKKLEAWSIIANRPVDDPCNL